jgi:ADP-ribosyl-[dinitrogen reductase] hydrolase
MTRTSLSDPPPIAAVTAGPGFGRIGITSCPGASGRDLARDLDAIADWGAVAVVTLLAPEELPLLGVERLGDEVARRGMRWFHLPIEDCSVPDEAFEQTWTVAGAELRAMLRGGSAVHLHCRGGLGRSGMIAARLLIELGTTPETAIANLRTVRPGAIENARQEAFVRKISAVPA